MPARGKERETDPHLLMTLVCPLTGAPLTLSRDSSELVSEAARLAFPIRDGIPIMIESEARKLSGKN
jgi:uncharacterized protein YbaR (Trm112 family)